MEMDSVVSVVSDAVGRKATVRRGVPIGAVCAVRRLNHEGRAYRVKIHCIGNRRKAHSHVAAAVQDGRRLMAPGVSEDQAFAALIKFLDPEVEIVRDERGNRLA